MATYNGDPQLSLPLSLPPPEPTIADAGDAPRRQPDSRHKLPAEHTDAELLTTVLGPSTTLPCLWLSAAYDDLREMAITTTAELREHGFTNGAVDKLGAVFEIAKRYGEREFKPGAPLRGSGDIYAHFRERLAAEPVEYFYAVLLDNKHRKLRDILVSLGSLTASIVHPRDVFHQIVRCPGVASVVFVHNHPSGDPTPSKEDIEITRRLREVGEIMGVRVLDHIVIGKGRYVSFVDDGYW